MRPWKWLLSLCLVGVNMPALANDFERLVQEGSAQAEAGNRAAAIASFEKARELEPKSPDVWYTLGVLHQCPKGVSYFEEAIRLDPGYWQAHYNIGVCSEKQGKHKEARSKYEEALRIFPDNPDLQYWVGTSYLGESKYSEAIPFLKASLGGATAKYQVALNLGNAYEGLRNLPEATSWFKKAISMTPTLPAGYIAVASPLEEQGKAKEAKAFLEKGGELALAAKDKPMISAALANLKNMFPESPLIKKLEAAKQ